MHKTLLNHKKVEIAALIANSNAGQEITQLYPHLVYYNLPILQKIEEVDFSEIDVVFGCLPHTTSQETFKRLSDSTINRTNYIIGSFENIDEEIGEHKWITLKDDNVIIFKRKCSF